MNDQRTYVNQCGCVVCTDRGTDRYAVPADYLHCKNVSWTLCPPGIRSEADGYWAAERTWWLRFEPLAQAWIRSAIESEAVSSPLESWHGAYVLLSAIYETCGADGSWVDLTGHEILFENLGHGGLLEGWSAEAVVFGMTSFTQYLKKLGAIEESVATHLLTELNAWSDRAIAFLKGMGPWLLADSSTPPPHGTDNREVALCS